ncbi:hypothetical protein F5X68DRAFT_195964 [Plectosphaerella plurivora]|uniref:Uncharacterized protein n=1 Tax=Plectosphaerella plurivora TaxID=936078 RepID=A0A9P8UZX8_9PEZI|nr:hypothetical protein F5X68DRAFT_195964 [Plectosphaerella plurivora]
MAYHSSSRGTLLVAFLAIFTSLAVANLWPIICLIMHQWRSTASPRLGLYHQQQAILSNTPSPAAAALSFTKLAWAWRQAKIKGTYRSSLVLITVSVLSLAIFAGAGLATAKIELDSDEVLVYNDKCGWPHLTVDRDFEPSESLNRTEQEQRRAVTSVWAHWISSRGLEYVRNCYTPSNVSVKSETCNTFTVTSLPLETRNVSCPFPDEICGLPEAFQVDTGFIDSNLQLGIDTAKDERIRFRKVSTCVPMRTERFSSDWIDQGSSETILPGDKYKYFNVGAFEDRDHTWSVSNYSLFYNAGAPGDKGIYTLGAVQSFADVRNDTAPVGFTPISALEVPDADTSVIYMTNNAQYATPVEDPWFRATNKTDPTGANRTMIIPDEFWISDQVSSALACTEQYQFCADDTCSPLAGVANNATNPWRGLELSEDQQELFNILSVGIEAITLAGGVYWLGPNMLRANEFVWFTDGMPFSTGLPPTQWQDEVVNFGQAMLAVLQRMVVDYASPSSFILQTSAGPVPSTQFIKSMRIDGDGQEICPQIRVRDARYTNFSGVGLLIVLFVGVFSIIVNVFLMPQAAFWARRKLHRTTYPEREWNAGNLLMQQRDALEAKGIGPWELDETTGVPWVKASGVTADARLLSVGSAYQPVEQQVSKDLRVQEKPMGWAQLRNSINSSASKT